MVYKRVSGLNITEAQAKKAAQGKAINLPKDQLKGGSVTVFLHPENVRKIELACRAGRGTQLQIARGEIEHDISAGGSLWSWLKDKTWPWLKKNYDVIKPVLTRVADTAVPALATALGQPELALPARGALKSLTGVGVAKRAKLVKGSPEAKAHMAAIRSKRIGKGIRLDI